jgi:hypothetical protein
MAVLLYSLFIGLAVWGFYEPTLAPKWFFVATGAFFLWIRLANWSLRSKTIGNLMETLTENESAFYRKHPLYFLFPSSARTFGGTCSLIQLLSLVWGAVSLWRGEWLYCAGMVAIVIAAVLTSVVINPGLAMRFAGAGRNSPEWLNQDLALLSSVENKVLAARGLRK